MQTFRELACAWQTRRAIIKPLTPATEARVRFVLEDVGRFRLDARYEKWLAWLAGMKARDLAPSTIAGRLGVARKICRDARWRLDDLIDPAQVPLDHLERLSREAWDDGIAGTSACRHRSATAEELNRLIATAQDTPGEIRFETLIPFAIATGLRRSELLRITWADVDFSRAILTVRDRKDPRNSRRTDRVPLSPAAIAVLRQLGPAPAPHARIFPYVANTLTNAFRRLRRAAGVRDLKFKDMRATCAQNLLNLGWPVDQVAVVTGHRSHRILLDHYASHEPERIALRLATLNGKEIPE